MAKTDGLVRENERIKTENYKLQSRVEKLEKEFKFKKGAVELELLLKDKIEMQNEQQMTQQDFMKKVSKLESELDEKDHELERKNEEIMSLQSTFTNMSMDSYTGHSVQTVRSQLERITVESQRELNQSRKTLRKKDREIETLQKELKRSQYLDKKNIKRISQLEGELESALKRVSFRGRRTPKGNSRNTSPYSKNKRGGS